MPALDIDRPGVSAVNAFGDLLVQLLDEASSAKTATTVEPALNKSDFTNLTSRVDATLPQQDEGATGETAAADSIKGRQFAIVEGAARDLFDSLIATISIDSPDFVKMWNFLDILSLLSDDGQCDPALLFWLVEELLDSQTIAGCRHIFDYLESRRERITAKNFKQKQLVILRSCNELLRRLSRAEDTAFCGRVFIFMFQCFPLGDRSSVNLRGEYHVENITSYETATADPASKMDVDVETPAAESTDGKADSKADGKADTNGSKNKEADKRLSAEELYPMFWALQESFSQPLRLFDAASFAEFKSSLEATMKTFEGLHADDQRGLKRKRNDESAEPAAEAFNPKYLTSSDLFELEISDLSFRRHVLVQALIITDFLLSLSPEAKQKFASLNASNKSVIYPNQLSEENTKWATEMKKRISEYLKRGFDGPYFYRMVETVLARDKNWVFWKMASCPPIQKNPVSPADFIEARSSAQRMATSKRLRPNPLGAVSLDFLRSKATGLDGMDELASAERYQLPELESFKRLIADDDFEIEMPTNDETKAAAIAGKSSKSWRALRIAGRSRLVAFDRIDDPKKIGIVFEDVVADDEADDADAEATAGEDDMPANRDAVIITGPRGVGKSALVSKLLQKRKGVFAPVVRHTTRQPQEGEANGKTFHFVPAAEFNQLRDGDRLVEYGSRGDVDYGTSTKAIEAVSETGKIPIIELDVEAAQFAKDMDFSARYILIKPTSADALSERLAQAGVDEADAKAVVAKVADIPGADVFDSMIVNGEELDDAVEAVDGYIYGAESGDKDDAMEREEEGKGDDGDAAMSDAEDANGEEEVDESEEDGEK